VAESIVMWSPHRPTGENALASSIQGKIRTHFDAALSPGDALLVVLHNKVVNGLNRQTGLSGF